MPPAAAVLGSTLPRLWTPPLVTGPPGPCGCGCALTPATSYGFDAVTFASGRLVHPLDPWQRWAAIHGGELLPDGRPRFRILIILVARQNGKTELLVVLCLFWQFVEAWPLILGTSTKLDYARESWHKSVKLANKCPDLDTLRPVKWTREANGEQESWTADESRYKIAASNEEGGRSLTINRLVCDELRQHHDYSAWGAAEPAASPFDAQIWALSNAGDDRSVVLNDHRDDAIKFIEWFRRESVGRSVAELLADPNMPGDPRLGLMEWSAPEDADPLDIHALAMANPNLGHRGTDADTLLNAARRAVRRGGEALTAFKTEKMCIRVRHTNPAVDPTGWKNCRDVGTLDAVRDRVACVVDVAPDGLHATLTAAAVLDDGRARVEPVKAWSGPGCVDAAGRALPGLLARVKPRAFGWFPSGPGAALAAALNKRAADWPPEGVEVEGIKGETPAVCMGFAEQVTAGRIAHSGDPLQDDHVGGAEKLMRGDVWVFSRKGEGHVDAAYAAAGAVHLARTLPPVEVYDPMANIH